MPLENEHLELFVSKFKQVSYIKGEYFIREGQVSRFLGFIIKGSLMCTYNKDGKEFIDEFSMDNEFITDYASFVTGAPADKNVVFLEDSDLLILGHSNLQELYKKDPIFERAGRTMAEMLFISRIPFPRFALLESN